MCPDSEWLTGNNKQTYTATACPDYEQLTGTQHSDLWEGWHGNQQWQVGSEKAAHAAQGQN